MKHIENSGEYAGLSVNKGISQPPSINPYLAQKLQHRRREYTAAEYIEEIRKRISAEDQIFLETSVREKEDIV